MLSSWRLELYSRGELLFADCGMDGTFSYTGSALRRSPADGRRFGIAEQQTKLDQTDIETQRGFLVGLAHRWAERTRQPSIPMTNRPSCGRRGFVPEVIAAAKRPPFPASRLRLPASRWMLAALLLVPLPALGRAAEVGALAPDALLGSVTNGVTAFAEAAQQSEAEFSAVEQARAGLVTALAGLKAPLPPAPEPVVALAEAGGESDEALKERLGRIEAYANAIERAEDRKGTAALLDAQIASLTRAEVKLQSLEALATSLHPLAVELQRRWDTGAISTGRVDLATAGEGLPEGLAGWVQRLAHVLTNGPAQRAQLAERKNRWTTERKALAEVEPADSRLTDELRAEREAARILTQAIEVGQTDLAELSGTEPGLLGASVERTARISASELASLEAATRRAAEQRAAFETIEREQLDLEAPSKDSIPLGEGHEELRAARQSLLYSTALVAYHQQRVNLIERLRAAASALLQEDREASRVFGFALRELVRLRAQLRTATGAGLAVTNQGGPDAAWAKLVEIALDEAGRRVEAKQLETRVADDTPLEAAKLELAREERENERRSAELRGEESYATLLEETSGQTDEQLIALLEPDGEIAQRLAGIAKEIAGQESAWTQAQEQYQRARQALSLIESPYTQLIVSQGVLRNEQLEAECAALEPGEIPADMSTALTPTAGTGGSRDDAAPGRVPLQEVARLEQQELEAEQAFANDLLRFFTDLEAAIVPLREAIAKLEERARASSEALNARVLQEKRRNACALELDRRIRAYRLPRSRAPRDLQQWTARDAVHAAEEARDQFARREARRAEQRKSDLERLEAVAALRPLAEDRYQLASEKVEVIGDPVTYLTSATTPFEQLPDVKRKELEYEAAVLDSKEAKMERLLSVVAPEIQARFEEPLRAFCLERMDGLRIINEYEAAQAAYEKLIQICTAQRETLAGALGTLHAVEDQRLLRYHTARHLAAIAAHPESASKIAGVFRAAYGQELEIPEMLGEVSRWAQELFSAEARLLGHRKWIKDVERQLSKLGLETEIGAYRRSASSITTAVETQRSRVAGIEAKSGTLREAYAARLRAELAWDLLAILVIPLVALVILRLLKRVVKRIERRAQVPPGEDQTLAQRRLQTLTSALWTTFSIIVWAVAAIYVLRRLGMNVTPIIASASVAGLAVAFAAQTLIRDFFYGFFVLLEHQFTVGDVVRIGNTAGLVEAMSLRVTKLRDLGGIAHYIPNGTIQQVSNITQNWARVVLDVPVAYKHDIDHVIRLLEQILGALREDPRWKRYILEEPTVAGVEQFADSSVNVRVLVKTAPFKQWDIGRDLRRRIKKVFDAEGVDIPLPQRVVHHVYDDETQSRPNGAAQGPMESSPQRSG